VIVWTGGAAGVDEISDEEIKRLRSWPGAASAEVVYKIASA
jgi:hypothetical protein